MNNYQLSVKKYSVYKDSAIAWLGDVPEHWEVKRVKDIGLVVLGKMLDSTGSNDKFYRYYLKSQNIGWLKVDTSNVEQMYFSLAEMKYCRLKRDDLLLSEGGEVGKTSIWEEEIDECYIQNSVQKITLYKNNSPRYFLYQSFLLGNIKYYDSIVNYVSIKHLTKEKLSKVVWVYPPPEEQKSIATYLDTKTAQCDRKIDLLTQKATQYGKLKQSLINETVTRGVEKSVPMKDSAIGKIPKHWEVKRLKDLSDIQNSNVDKKSYDDEIPVKLCNYVDVYKNEFIDSSLNFMEATATKSEIKQFTIKKGDVFITKDSETCDDIAIPALATESLDGVLCGYHLARFRMKEKIFLGSYLFRLFQSKSYGFRFVISAKGITRVGLGQSSIADALTPVPPLSEQKAIADYLDTKTAQIDQIIQTINTQIEKLKELRKTLINDVVTGKIKVIDN